MLTIRFEVLHCEEVEDYYWDGSGDKPRDVFCGLEATEDRLEKEH